MAAKITLLTILISFSSASNGTDISPAELKALRSTVIEICRGGTLQGKISYSTVKTKNVITIKNLTEGSSDIDFVLSTEQWSGVKVLINNPVQYSACVKKLLGILAPSYAIKKNIDKDLNARVEYIRSQQFCERLRYVVSRAPFDFEEWRDGSGISSGRAKKWRIGPFVMGNPEALGMTQSSDLELNYAVITEYKDRKQTVFSEPIVFTHRFKANNEIGLLVENIRKAVDRCITYKYFYGVKKVRYRGGPYEFKNGMPYWSFDKTGFLGASVKGFIVTLNTYDLDYMGEWTKVVSINVHAP